MNNREKTEKIIEAFEILIKSCPKNKYILGFFVLKTKLRLQANFIPYKLKELLGFSRFTFKIKKFNYKIDLYYDFYEKLAIKTEKMYTVKSKKQINRVYKRVFKDE